MLDVAVQVVCFSMLFFSNFRTICCKVYGHMDKYDVFVNLFFFL
jgi:hypothetical protein